MSPALRPRDYLLLRRGRLPASERAFGRIVALRDREGRLLLKRVVGLPGESLRVGADVQIDGHLLHEPYASGQSADERRHAPLRLGPGEFFLLGDRRDASTDSRDFGPVDASRIEAIAWLRYWPPGRVGPLRRPRRRLLDSAAPSAAPRNQGNP